MYVYKLPDHLCLFIYHGYVMAFIDLLIHPLTDLVCLPECAADEYGNAKFMEVALAQCFHPYGGIRGSEKMDKADFYCNNKPCYSCCKSPFDRHHLVGPRPHLRYVVVPLHSFVGLR